MSRSICAVLFLFPVSFAFAQLDSNSITVTASRTNSLQPDLALFSATVTADPSATVNDVLNALQPLHVSINDLSSVGNNGYAVANQVTLDWSFSLSAPLSNLKDTVATLTKLQGTIGQTNKSFHFSLWFSFNGTTFSPQAQQSQPCVIADLVNDARTKATGMANAAGRTLSSVLAVSGMTAPPSNTASSAPNCSVTVKFALLGS